MRQEAASPSLQAIILRLSINCPGATPIIINTTEDVLDAGRRRRLSAHSQKLVECDENLEQPEGEEPKTVVTRAWAERSQNLDEEEWPQEIDEGRWSHDVDEGKWPQEIMVTKVIEWSTEK